MSIKSRNTAFLVRTKQLMQYEGRAIGKEMFEAYLALGPGDYLSSMTDAQCWGLCRFLDMVIVQLETNHAQVLPERARQHKPN